jgi:hypothetical protein
MPGVNTIRQPHNEAMEGPSNPKTMIKPKTTAINASPIPHLHHSMNPSTLSSILYPGITIRYWYTSKTNPLEVAMKKPSGNPKTKQVHQHVLMKPHPHPRHERTHLLGVTYEGDSMNGTQGQGVLMTKNNPEMKKTFRNEEAMRMMMWTIWLQGLVDIKEVLRDIVL